MQQQIPVIEELNKRSRDIFRHIVETFMETGEPVGSRYISKLPDIHLSAASVRNVMSDLEDIGLLYSPHTSAGRLPTELGLQLFVHGFLEIGDVDEADRESITAHCQTRGRSIEDMLGEASSVLSGLSQCAGLVIAPKLETPLKHLEFVSLGPGRALVVMVTASGMVENRIIELPPGITPSMLIEAGNYLYERLQGRTIREARASILAELKSRQEQLDDLTSRLIESGLAEWSGEGPHRLIVRGRANLLENVHALEDLEKIRLLFEELERKRDFVNLIDITDGSDGVQIFIGSKNRLFSMSGSSVIVSPFKDSQQNIVGAIGVIGPTRLNYARIVPMVDFTAKVIGRLIG